MTWEHWLIAYAVCGVVAYVAIMLYIRFIEANTSAGVFRGIGENLERWAEEVEQKKNPSRLRWLKIHSARWIGNLVVALLVIAVWPVAIAWKAWIWFSLHKETEGKKRYLRTRIGELRAPFIASDRITFEEKIYILFYRTEEIWRIKESDFYDLTVTALDLVLVLLQGVENGLVVNDPSELLAFSNAEVATFCDENKLPSRARDRLARWRQWSQSAEAKAIEDFFRQKWSWTTSDR